MAVSAIGNPSLVGDEPQSHITRPSSRILEKVLKMSVVLLVGSLQVGS